MFSGRDGLGIVWSKAGYQSGIAQKRNGCLFHCITGGEEEALRGSCSAGVFRGFGDVQVWASSSVLSYFTALGLGPHRET